MNKIPDEPSKTRRSMWSALDEKQEKTPPVELQDPQSVLSQLRLAEKKPRRRDWEKESSHHTNSFRCVPPDLQQALKQIAGSLHVRIDDVARAFLEYGLKSYRNSRLPIVAVLQQERLTLFPVGGMWTQPRFPGWVERSWDLAGREMPGARRVHGDSRLIQPWKWPVVSYRGLPAELTTALQELHVEHHVPVGEVVTLFLTYSLAAYQSGRLDLFPQPAGRKETEDA